MAALEAGSYVYLCYDPFPEWHVRLVLSWVGAGDYVVLTPDGDIYIEQLDSNNVDLSGIRYSDGGSTPVGLAGQPIYDFRPRPSGVQLGALLREGQLFAVAERQARGLAGVPVGAPVGAAALAPSVVPLPLPAPVAAPGAAPPVAAPRIAVAGGTWVLDEPTPSFKVGQEVVLPAAAVDFGGRALITVEGRVVGATRVQAGGSLDDWIVARCGQLLACDQRLIPPELPRAERSLAEAERMMASAPAGGFAGLNGPSTVEENMRSIASRSGHFEGHHDRWVVESKIELSNRSRHEHKVLCKTLALAVKGGYNIKRGACFEYVNRRRLLLEEAHREDVSKPNFEYAHLYMGEQADQPGAASSSALRAHVAAELAKESAILKEKRKAREAREGHKPKSGGKGDGGK